jgi:hypothetical protein
MGFTSTVTKECVIFVRLFLGFSRTHLKIITLQLQGRILHTEYETRNSRSWQLGITLFLAFYHLRVVLYGCETWSLTLREEHWLKVFENRVLSRIFGPKRDEVWGGLRKLHNEELHKLYSSPNNYNDQVKEMKLAGHVARNGKENECM